MAEVLRQTLKRKQAWPYEHIFPPRDSIEVNQIATTPTLGVGILTPILTYTVPMGLKFYLTAVLMDFLGAVFHPGDALWTVDRDFSIASVQGAYVQGFIQVPVPLGSFAVGRRWELPRAYEFGPLETVRSTAYNVNLGVGSPNDYVSGFFGYLVPSTKGKD